MGLPYLLGDKDPKDPTNGWEQDLGLPDRAEQVRRRCYPSTTSETMKNLANGSAKIIASTTGWDINPRVLGTVPEGRQGRLAARASTG